MTLDSYKYYIINISYIISQKAEKLISLQESDECNNCKELLEFNMATAIFKELLRYSYTIYDEDGEITIQGEGNCYTDAEYQSLLNFLNILLGTSYCTDISNITN